MIGWFLWRPESTLSIFVFQVTAITQPTEEIPYEHFRSTIKPKKSAESCLCVKPLGSLEPCWRIGGLRCSWEGRVRFLLQCRHVRSSEFRHRVKPIKNWEDMEEPNQSRTETEKLRLCREINGANCRVQNKRTHTICWTWAPGSQLAQAEEREAMRGREGGRERRGEGAPNDASREQNGAFRRQKPH